MDTVDTYINILNDTLQKKNNVLKQIYDATEEQKGILQSGQFDEEKFQKTISLKEMLLDELEQLDNGFSQIYERVSLALKHNKEMYKEEILTAQRLIQGIMDLSVSIQALEEQNKIRFPGCVMERRKQVNSIKANSKAVTNYYKNMPNTHQTGQSYFVDKKN